MAGFGAGDVVAADEPVERAGFGFGQGVVGFQGQLALLGDVATHFSTAEDQVERHAYPWQKEDDQQPGDRARRGALLQQDVRDQHDAQQEPADQQHVCQDGP